jgi:hypothetical protein
LTIPVQQESLIWPTWASPADLGSAPRIVAGSKEADG